jgi:hypothetical protein
LLAPFFLAPLEALALTFFGLFFVDVDCFWTVGMAAFYLCPPNTERGKWGV